jgi:hypothetical protein
MALSEIVLDDIEQMKPAHVSYRLRVRTRGAR